MSTTLLEGTTVVEWRSVEMKPGVQCVMTHGTALMLVWLADSWDSPDTVCYIFCMIANHSINGALQMLWHVPMPSMARDCLLYTSDAADE